MKYASFLATSYLTFTNEPCQPWSYWTEFHEIFTQYTDIICAVNAHIVIAISRSISECQSDESGEFAILVQQILRYLFRYLLSNHDKLRQLATQVPFVKLFSTKTTGPIFTKILHDIVALVGSSIKTKPSAIWRTCKECT